MRGLDIAVAGCGPCGLAAALLLSRRGHRVTLFERFDAPRPIGSGLMIQPTGLAVLRQLGLDARIISEGARINRLFGMAGNRTVLDVHYRALGNRGCFGVGIHRSSLFDSLHDEVGAKGIPIVTGMKVEGCAIDGSKRRLGFADGSRSDAFDLVVDAMGMRTPLAEPSGRDLAYGALWATLDWPDTTEFDQAALQQRYRRSSVMIGVLPIGAGKGGRKRVAFFWSLRHDELENWHAAGLDRWKSDVAALWPACTPLLDQIAGADQLTFARYSHRTLKEPCEQALVHIGDAWHSASPQLGQGANMALLDAWALVEALEKADSIGEAQHRFIQMRSSHVRIYQWLTALFTPVYQSDSRALPFIRDRLVGPLSKFWPASWIQAAMVSGLIGDPLTPLGLSDRSSAFVPLPRANVAETL